MKRVFYVGGVLMTILMGGCAGSEKEPEGFFTSGSRQADQRAEQQMARTQQARSSGESSEEKPVVKSLYDRIGGEQGIRAIVNDFVTRATNDPRVNWNRKGIERGGVLGMGGRSVEWQGTPEQLERLKAHMAQFLSLATGGPSAYGGREMKQVHEGMRITNDEFDASIGDLKATLDKLQIPADEQRELLSVMESTRAQVVEQR